LAIVFNLQFRFEKKHGCFYIIDINRQLIQLSNQQNWSLLKLLLSNLQKYHQAKIHLTTAIDLNKDHVLVNEKFDVEGIS